MVSSLSKLIDAISHPGIGRWIAFQINRGERDSTEEPGDKSVFLGNSIEDSDDDRKRGLTRRRNVWHAIEVVMVFLCFTLFAGQLPPDVNESHYLTKAKHFWNPVWCDGDIFLSSSFAHWFFYITTGWLTRFMSLAAAAWTGRILTWALLAFAWQRLSWRLVPARGMAIASAAFFLLLNDRFHLAGEWVVGGFEAKGLAYFFVLMALGWMASSSWRWVWPMLGLASAFHVLVGGWAFVSATFAWIAIQWAQVDGRPAGVRHIMEQLKLQILPLATGAALAMVGILPPLLADQSAPAEVSAAARLIYVNHRIAHHLTFDAFPTINVARFALIVVFWFLLNRWLENRCGVIYRKLQPLTLFGLGSLLISFGGLLLSGISEQSEQLAETTASLLRFYWFRLSDFAIPTATAFATCSIIWFWLKTDRRIATRISCSVFIVCIFGASGLVIFDKHQDPRPRADQHALPDYPQDPTRTLDTYKNWLKVCQWVRQNTPADATFITPNQQQTFKWYAGRSEVVCWKDIPQDSNGILEWRKRLVALYEPQRRYENGLMCYSDDQLRELALRYGATHLLIPQRHVDLAAVATQLKRVYPTDADVRSTYVVFEF